jgi:CDP-diacylglycerol---glycerol-3-phosphate 3-phosphatidyltransferase
VVLNRSTLPNAITVARIASTPVVFLLLFTPTFTSRFIAWVLFLAAAISDLWDGYLARKHGWITDFGKLFDPIADKLLLVATFLPFYILSQRPDTTTRLPVIGTLPLWILLVVIGREALVTGIRSFAARRGLVIPAGPAGKLKAVFQNIFIGTTILWFALRTAGEDRGWSGRFWNGWQAFHATILLTTLAVAVILTVYSMLVYLREWRRSVRGVL